MLPYSSRQEPLTLKTSGQQHFNTTFGAILKCETTNTVIPTAKGEGHHKETVFPNCMKVRIALLDLSEDSVYLAIQIYFLHLHK